MLTSYRTREQMGETPLMTAIEANADATIVKVLIDGGAAIDFGTTVSFWGCVSVVVFIGVYVRAYMFLCM